MAGTVHPRGCGEHVLITLGRDGLVAAPVLAVEAEDDAGVRVAADRVDLGRARPPDGEERADAGVDAVADLSRVWPLRPAAGASGEGEGEDAEEGVTSGHGRGGG